MSKIQKENLSWEKRSKRQKREGINANLFCRGSVTQYHEYIQYIHAEEKKTESSHGEHGNRCLASDTYWPQSGWSWNLKKHTRKESNKPKQSFYLPSVLEDQRPDTEVFTMYLSSEPLQMSQGLQTRSSKQKRYGLVFRLPQGSHGGFKPDVLQLISPLHSR